MGDEARYAAMVEYIGSFALSGSPPQDIGELSDGVAFFDALAEIAPDHFDASTIARGLGDNWALKSSNLRKLTRNLENYFHEVLHKDADFESAAGKVSAIARHGDRDAIASIFELLAAAAVTCEERSKFVGRIIQMSPECQFQMKSIIESSLARISDYESPSGNPVTQETEEPEVVFDDYDDDNLPDELENLDVDSAAITEMSTMFRTAMDEISNMSGGAGAGDEATDVTKVSIIIQERDELRSALQDARRELAAHKSQSAVMAEDTEAAQRKIRSLAEDLQDRLKRREEELSETQDELAKTKRSLRDLEEKSTDLEEKNANLADELDVANSKAAQLRKAEATVVAYRKKLEGVGVMNQQMTELEDQAAGHVRKIVDLESEVKQVPTLKKNIDELQSQLAKVKNEKQEVEEVLKSKGTEVSKLKADVSAAESAKKIFAEELEEIRAQQEGELDGEGFGAGASEAKERALRLDLENKDLKKKMEELKEKVKTAQSSASAAALVAGGASGNSDVTALRVEVTRLQEEVKKKEGEKEKLSSDKEKLEAYTKKTLAKFQEKYLVALHECKAKLQEKHNKIEALEKRSQSEKTAQKREERLLSSTIYELGLTILQQRLKDR